MQQNEMDYNEQRRKSLVRSLRIVLVLTFIGSGVSALSFLSTGIMLPLMQEMRDNGMVDFSGVMAEAYDMFLAMPQSYYLVGAVLYALSLTGALMMWDLRKNGFHFYTIAQLLLIVSALVFVGRMGVQVGDVMLTVLFVAYYYIALRGLGLMGNSQQNTDDTFPADEESSSSRDSE